MTGAAGEVNIIEEPTDGAKPQGYIILGLLALAGLLFFFGLGRLALVGPDEPRYAEVAREMYETGDYVSTRLCGCLWFEKPALFYWMSAGAYHLFGVSEFAARFPSALAALVMVAFLCQAVWRHVSARLALAASLVLVTSGIIIGYGRAATPDMALTAAIAIALLSAYISTVTEGRERLGYWLLGWAAVGLAVLAKGLVGLLLVVLIFALYLLAAGQVRRVSWKQCAYGLAVFLAVAAAWYVPVTWKHGWQFINEFFVEHHIQRYVTNRYYHPQPVYFYLFVAAAGVLPWTFFLVPAVWRLRSLKPRGGGVDSLVALAWIWLAVPVAFFSFSESKLPGYLLPVFPALAIIIGAEVERFWAGGRARAMKIAGWMTELVLLALAFGFDYYLSEQGVVATGRREALSWVPWLLAMATALLIGSGKSRIFITGAAAVVLSIVVGTVVLLFPAVNDRWSLKPLSLQAAAALRPGERITFFILKEFAPVFYTEGRVVCGVDEKIGPDAPRGEGVVLNALKQDTLARALETEPSLIVITIERWLDDLEDDGRFVIEPVAQQGEAYALRVRLKR